MNKLHILTILCFLLAGAFYTASNVLAIGFGVLGILFELIAWTSWIKAGKTSKQ